jgi:hypothetical protein
LRPGYARLFEITDLTDDAAVRDLLGFFRNHYVELSPTERVAVFQHEPVKRALAYLEDASLGTEARRVLVEAFDQASTAERAAIADQVAKAVPPRMPVNWPSFFAGNDDRRMRSWASAILGRRPNQTLRTLLEQRLLTEAPPEARPELVGFATERYPSSVERDTLIDELLRGPWAPADALRRIDAQPGYGRLVSADAIDLHEAIARHPGDAIKLAAHLTGRADAPPGTTAAASADRALRELTSLAASLPPVVRAAAIRGALTYRSSRRTSQDVDGQDLRTSPGFGRLYADADLAAIADDIEKVVLTSSGYERAQAVAHVLCGPPGLDAPALLRRLLEGCDAIGPAIARRLSLDPAVPQRVRAALADLGDATPKSAAAVWAHLPAAITETLDAVGPPVVVSPTHADPVARLRQANVARGTDGTSTVLALHLGAYRDGTDHGAPRIMRCYAQRADQLDAGSAVRRALVDLAASPAVRDLSERIEAPALAPMALTTTLRLLSKADVGAVRGDVLGAFDDADRLPEHRDIDALARAGAIDAATAALAQRIAGGPVLKLRDLLDALGHNAPGLDALGPKGAVPIDASARRRLRDLLDTAFRWSPAAIEPAPHLWSPLTARAVTTAGTEGTDVTHAGTKQGAAHGIAHVPTPGETQLDLVFGAPFALRLTAATDLEERIAVNAQGAPIDVSSTLVATRTVRLTLEVPKGQRAVIVPLTTCLEATDGTTPTERVLDAGAQPFPFWAGRYRVELHDEQGLTHASEIEVPPFATEALDISAFRGRRLVGDDGVPLHRHPRQLGTAPESDGYRRDTFAWRTDRPAHAAP